MNRTMNALVVLALLAVSTARAEWRDLKTGLDAKSAAELVGQPLMATKARGGVMVTWVFDHGGYMLFENGRLRFWQAPHPEKP